MNVLSLFDGMSCGRIALERAGIKVDNYFSSEVDKYAIKVADNNWPNDSKHRLGDVRLVSSTNLPKIDLLIGGSPCQSFSFAGKRKGMSTKDEVKITDLGQYLELKKSGFEFEGQSYLFWEYMRILKETKPKYFLLENVKMSKKWKDVLSKAIGVEPILINSNLVSAQNRQRLYWTNIPNIKQPEDKGIVLKDILNINLEFDREPYFSSFKQNNTKNVNTLKHPTLCANSGGKTRGIGVHLDSLFWRKLTPIECESLQTVSKNYTDVVSSTQRYKMLGNGWTVDVIAHIFKNI